MRIEINNPNNVLDFDFGKWLCKRVSMLIRYKMNRQKLNMWSDYLTETKIFEPTYSDKIFADKFILQAANSLICNSFSSLLCIEINNKTYAEGLNQVKLIDVIKLITFGNQEKQGYSLIKDVFEEVAENINEYVNKYTDGVETWL